MPKIQVLIRAPNVVRLWRVGRLAALVALVAVLALLVWAPEQGLALVWGGAIPIVALSLFITPVAWRGVCPLATLNELGNRVRIGPPPPPELQRVLGAAGLVLFHILVPARLLLFNHNGPALVAAALAVGVLAIGLGAWFAVRSAFCNALCPILPVERLYGQSPLVVLERARCTSCSVCTPRGCLDLAATKSLPQFLGPSRRSIGWLASPFGIFATCLPGFIIGYFLAPSHPAALIDAYGYTLTGSFLSYLLLSGSVLVADLAAAEALPIIAAASGGVYFAFTGPAVARLWHFSEALGLALSAALVLFVIFWLARALDRTASRVLGGDVGR